MHRWLVALHREPEQLCSEQLCSLFANRRGPHPNFTNGIKYLTCGAPGIRYLTHRPKRHKNHTDRTGRDKDNKILVRGGGLPHPRTTDLRVYEGLRPSNFHWKPSYQTFPETERNRPNLEWRTTEQNSTSCFAYPCFVFSDSA